MADAPQKIQPESTPPTSTSVARSRVDQLKKVTGGGEAGAEGGSGARSLTPTSGIPDQVNPELTPPGDIFPSHPRK